ncbi:hypothetical protein MPSEU_001032600 [Mayamaea pseudoterrestris]|nr:hypothetical protein MPSEU_001032600 [Mayamaea pseudoterrestris]
MPPKNNKKKKSGKKNKTLNRSVDAVFCANCERSLATISDRVTCVCTRVRFCSINCQQQAISTGKHECPGPPQQSTFLQGTDPRSFSLHGAPENIDSTKRELQETVHTKLRPLVTQYMMRHNVPDGSENQMYIDLANEGSPEAAYLAGIAFRHRSQFIVPTSQDEGDFGNMEVLKSDMYAFKYFKQAAKGGIGLGMQSLADMYNIGQGVRQNIIASSDWLWHATLIHSFKASEILETRTLIPRELYALIHSFEQMRHRVPAYGASANQCCPNLTGLLTKLSNTVRNDFDCMLAPFAAPTPTLTVGSQPRRGETGDVVLIGATKLRELLELVRLMNLTVNFGYGRRGTCKGATAQTYSGSTRVKDSFYYQVPPMPQCDETASDEMTQSFYDQLLKENVAVLCVHSEAKSGQSEVACWECLAAARIRLEAVSHGGVALSLYETLLARGRTAVWRNLTGELQSETFKTYCRADVESVLGTLVAYKPKLAHPLFIAQDPNFFWPLISYHGTIRAALEYVAPHVDWNASLGMVKVVPEQQPLVEDAEPGMILCRCGHELCFKFEAEDKIGGVLHTCSGCDSRPYCSKSCLQADWPFHKPECAATNLKAEKARPTIGDYELDSPHSGEAVVLRGLVAKPALNDQVATVSGRLNSQGRYPVRVRGSDVPIAVRPENVQQLGLYIKYRAGKAPSVKCVKHRAELCEDCCFDFSIINHLLRLSFNHETITSHHIEVIADRFFAQNHYEDSDVQSLDVNFPQVECQGLGDRDKKSVLAALLCDREANGPLNDAMAAIVGLSCFSARSLAFVQPYCLSHLESALKVIEEA